jgi:hypothetical protein
MARCAVSVRRALFFEWSSVLPSVTSTVSAHVFDQDDPQRHRDGQSASIFSGWKCC